MKVNLRVPVCESRIVRIKNNWKVILPQESVDTWLRSWINLVFFKRMFSFVKGTRSTKWKEAGVERSQRKFFYPNRSQLSEKKESKVLHRYTSVYEHERVCREKNCIEHMKNRTDEVNLRCQHKIGELTARISIDKSPITSFF